MRSWMFVNCGNPQPIEPSPKLTQPNPAGTYTRYCCAAVYWCYCFSSHRYPLVFFSGGGVGKSRAGETWRFGHARVGKVPIGVGSIVNLELILGVGVFIADGEPRNSTILTSLQGRPQPQRYRLAGLGWTGFGVVCCVLVFRYPLGSVRSGSVQFKFTSAVRQRTRLITWYCDACTAYTYMS